jgi:hypothetical protein
MTRTTLWRAAREYCKHYAAAFIAADLMFVGVKWFISALNNPLADGLLRLINATIQEGFRGRMPLRDIYGGIPWGYHAGIAAEGTIAMVLGVLVGLWVNSKEQSRPTSDR